MGSGQVDVPDYASTDKDILDGAQVRILDVLNDGYVVKLEVQVLINALEGAADLDAVLELNGDLDVDQRLEETEK